MPDVVTLYRLPLCEFARNEDELVEEVMVTVVHEIAHHFGIDDDKLHEWAGDDRCRCRRRPGGRLVPAPRVHQDFGLSLPSLVRRIR